MSKKIKKVVWGLWMFGVVLILFPILKMGILVEKQRALIGRMTRRLSPIWMRRKRHLRRLN